MTLFVASIYLPYTVNFEDPKATPALSETSSSSEDFQLEHYVDRVPTPAKRNTLPILPKTPGATTNHEEIFQPYVERLFTLTSSATRKNKEDVEQLTKSVTISVPGPIVTRNPRAIPLSDLHSPSIFPTQYWNQPKSRAKLPPPVDVRLYNAQVRERTARAAQFSITHSRERSRTTSNERRFAEDNFNIEQNRHGNAGLVNAIDAVSEQGLLTDRTWVGTLGMPTDAVGDHVKEVISERLEHDYEALPVYVNDGDFDGHYEHYCKTILWPIFHYQIPDGPKNKAYEDHSWVYYVKVNQAFADRIIQNYKKGDSIWVHDYHLMLVPGMLREKLPDAEIGFFIHTAFPSSEVFRVLATREKLLKGILGANMVAFQAEEYGQHFIQTCSRILNVEATKKGVVLEDYRFVHVNTVPIGIDPKTLDNMRAVPEVTTWTRDIAERYAGKRIIIARDKLDVVGGVKQKMLAYELFLNRYPKYRNQVVLIQITTSTSEDANLSNTVAGIATRINSTYSTLAHQPLVYLRQDIDHSQYLALLSVAECLMITGLREGMNLGAHEYIYCQDGKFNNNKWSPLILSEFTGSASVLGNSQPISINPWDYSQCANAIKAALDMTVDERKARWHNMHCTVLNNTATKWYTTFRELLNHAWEEHSIRDSTTVPRLSVPNLLAKYQDAKRRLLVLDYEGTLASWGSPDDIVVSTPKRLQDILNDLLEDKRNTVYVMSSRMPEELERLFKLVPGLGLIAENGAFLLEAGTDEWSELTDLNHVRKWKSSVKDILRYYVDRVEGSKIDERHSTIIFDYSGAEDIAGASKQAAECANHMNDACSNQNIQAIPIENGLCVCTEDLNKGSATALIGDNLLKLSEEKGVPMPDFLLVIGDARDDEYAFSWALDLEKKGVVSSVHTVTLGARNTSAGATLTQGVTGVTSTLRKLAATPSA